ncbi:MAG: 5'-methylthioadenosine/S-adenosylhomocysteine nucleosidase [Geminicoccaceae bacterium]
MGPHSSGGPRALFNPTDLARLHRARPRPAAHPRAARRLRPAAVLAGRGRHRAPPRVTFGTILTGDQFLNCEATRRRLFEELGGHAIEMEGGAVGQVAEAFGLPHLVIRALSDLAGAESHFDFGRFVEETAAGSAAILRHLLPAL